MEQNKRISELLKNTIGQRYDAMALRMISDVSEVPENALYPLRDLGQHMALCQAFALSRREGRTVYMQKQDHWCFGPLIGYGHIKLEKGTPEFNELLPVIGIFDPDAAAAFIENSPHLPAGKYQGILYRTARHCGICARCSRDKLPQLRAAYYAHGHQDSDRHCHEDRV